MKPLTPEVIKLPKRTVLSVTLVGAPGTTASTAMPALYGTAYGTKSKVFKPKKKEMKIGAPSAFWPDAHRKPKSKWTAIWNLEIPAFVKQKDLIQKNPKLPAKITMLKAGLYAQVLYIGTYDSEGPTIKQLHAYIKEQKLVLAGPHEEVYLSRPGPRAKTIIRYAVKPAPIPGMRSVQPRAGAKAPTGISRAP